MVQDLAAEVDQVRGMGRVKRHSGAEDLEPEQVDGLEHIPGELIVMHLAYLVLADGAAKSALKHSLVVKVRYGPSDASESRIQRREDLVTELESWIRSPVVWLKSLKGLLLSEWEDETRLHVVPLLKHDVLEMHDLLVILGHADATRLYVGRKVDGVSELVQEGEVLLGVFSHSELLDVKEVLRSIGRNITNMVRRVFEVFRVPGHNGGHEL